MYNGILPFHRATAPKAAAHGGGFIILWDSFFYGITYHTYIPYHIILRTGGGGSTDTILNFLLLETFSLIYLYKEIALRHFSQKSRCVQDHE